MSTSSGTLTDEQKERIEKNRALALQKRKDAEEKEASKRCSYVHPETGDPCESRDIVPSLYADFGELICLSCKNLCKDDYTLINKSDSMARYLVPEDTMRILKFTTKKNPRNPKFADMKLYLVKHVREKSFKRWGDAQGLLNELDRREKDRFERGLKECEDALAVKDDDEELEGNDKEVDTTAPSSSSSSSSSSSLSPLHSLLSGGKRKRDTKKNESKSTRKSKAKIGAMVSAIKG